MQQLIQLICMGTYEKDLFWFQNQNAQSQHLQATMPLQWYDSLPMPCVARA